MIGQPEGVTPYNPYSNYDVRAAVITTSGHVYYGCNIENVNFSLTKHAEETAVVNAYLNEQPTDRRFIRTVYIWTKDGGTPCGGCRQFLHEFATADCQVTCWDGDGGHETYRLADLLPSPFGPESLGL